MKSPPTMLAPASPGAAKPTDAQQSGSSSRIVPWTVPALIFVEKPAVRPSASSRGPVAKSVTVSKKSTVVTAADRLPP